MHLSCFGWKIVFPWRKFKPRCFRDASVTFCVKNFVKIFHRSSPFFVRSSCVLRSSTGKFLNSRLSIHFLFCWFSSSFCSLSVFFSFYIHVTSPFNIMLFRRNRSTEKSLIVIFLYGLRGVERGVLSAWSVYFSWTWTWL